MLRGPEGYLCYIATGGILPYVSNIMKHMLIRVKLLLCIVREESVHVEIKYGATVSVRIDILLRRLTRYVNIIFKAVFLTILI